MLVENGEWIMHGLDWENPYRIRTWQELMNWIYEIGFLPLFGNEVSGFFCGRANKRFFYTISLPLCIHHYLDIKESKDKRILTVVCTGDSVSVEAELWTTMVQNLGSRFFCYRKRKIIARSPIKITPAFANWSNLL